MLNIFLCEDPKGTNLFKGPIDVFLQEPTLFEGPIDFLPTLEYWKFQI